MYSRKVISHNRQPTDAIEQFSSHIEQMDAAHEGKSLMSNNAHPVPPVYFVLMTSLFYPAVLGTVFYSMLESFSGITSDLKSWLLMLCCVAITISFSVDFLYTYSSKYHYQRTLFVSDMVILFLLFVSYRVLINSLQKNTAATGFFVCYALIHGIFLGWDLSLIPKAGVDRRVLAYDGGGLVAALVGLAFFRDSAVAGLVILWLLTIAYLWVGVTAIVPKIRTD